MVHERRTFEIDTVVKIRPSFSSRRNELDYVEKKECCLFGEYPYWFRSR